MDESNQIPTDDQPIATLLNPSCGIPYDVYFAFDDEEGGTLRGLVGAHRNLLALKSPDFKRELFGPLKESDPVHMKDTSVGAFKVMLRYIYNGPSEDDWSKMDIHEVVRIANLAERYHLPGLMSKTVDFAKRYQLSKKNLVETFCLAESLPFKELSEAFLQNCDDFLLTILATARDYSVFVKKYAEEGAVLRLLARVNHSDFSFVDTSEYSILMQEAKTCMRNLKRSIRPHHSLKKLLSNIRIVKEGNTWHPFEYYRMTTEDVPILEEYQELIISLSDSLQVIVQSLKNCMKMDADAAANRGKRLTWKRRMKDSESQEKFTHQETVRMHLKLLEEIRIEMPGTHGIDGPALTWEAISVMVSLTISSKTIPEARECLLDWLSNNFLSLNKEARTRLIETLILPPVASVPGFSSGFNQLYKTCKEYANYDSDDDPTYFCCDDLKNTGNCNCLDNFWISDQ